MKIILEEKTSIYTPQKSTYVRVPKAYTNYIDLKQGARIAMIEHEDLKGLLITEDKPNERTEETAH